MKETGSLAVRTFIYTFLPANPKMSLTAISGKSPPEYVEPAQKQNDGQSVQSENLLCLNR